MHVFAHSNILLLFGIPCAWPTYLPLLGYLHWTQVCDMSALLQAAGWEGGIQRQWCHLWPQHPDHRHGDGGAQHLRDHLHRSHQEHQGEWWGQAHSQMLCVHISAIVQWGLFLRWNFFTNRWHLAYFANTTFADCIFVLATPYRVIQYSRIIFMCTEQSCESFLREINPLYGVWYANLF